MSQRWAHEPSWLARLARWVALHPVTGSAAARQVADELVETLSALGFSVEVCGGPGHAPLLVARRASGSDGPILGLYGHYDVEPARGRWRSDPRRLRVERGRAYGRGVADNLGPLTARLSAAQDVRRWPGVLWVLEGEEETGSRQLSETIASLRTAEVALWLDETGYFAAPGHQRILTRRRDHRLDALCATWRALAADHGADVSFESRALNRASTTAVGPVEQLFADVPYAALGPNDHASNVHGVDESLPLATLALTARQLAATFEHLADEGAQ